MLSCTDMRAAEAAPAIEASLGKPVVTSNRAMMRAALKRVGVSPGERALRRRTEVTVARTGCFRQRFPAPPCPVTWESRP